MKNKKGFIKNNYIYLILIIIIAILFIGYIYKDNTLRSHDLSFHIANIKNIIDNNLKVSLIMPNLANNLGYGLYIFYPILPHFMYACIAKVFSVFNIELINSILIINILISITSSILMYILSLKLSKNKKIAFISAIIYLLFPYRLGTITVRMALNENFTSMFIPLILLGISYLFADKPNYTKFLVYFTIGYTGLILSHLITAMYFTIILLIILIFYLDKLLNKEVLKTFLKGVLCVSLLVLPNIIIFLEHYGLDYLVYQENYVTSISLIEENILELKDLIIPEDNYDWTIPFYIYLPVLISLIYSTYLSIKNKNFNYMLMILIIMVLGFMLTSEVFWNIAPHPLYNIQFPWRLLLILSVFISLLAPMFIEKIKNNKIYLLIVILLIIPSLILINKLTNRTYNLDYTIIDIEDGTGNIKEYYPTAYIFYKDYYKSKENIDVINGNGDVEIIENNLSKNILTFKIENTNYINIELPRIYYKGYELIDKNNNKINIEKSNLGFISANITETGTYTLKYKGTMLYNFFKLVRIGFILFIIGKIIKKIKLKNVVFSKK